jgi:hypothetical protein
MLSWFKVVSICSLTYSASAMPKAVLVRAQLGQVIENAGKKGFRCGSCAELRAARD